MHLKRIDVELTTACNLRCIHCFAESGFKKTEMHTSLLLKAVKKAKNAKIIYLSGGEPLLHPDFFKIAKKISDLGVFFGVMTNATLFDEGKIKKLSKLKIGDLQISLEGATPETHDYIRGVNGSFEKTIGAIITAKNYGIPISIRTVIMRHNIHEIEMLSILCSQLDVDLSFSLPNPVGRISQKSYPEKEEYMGLISTVFNTDEISLLHTFEKCGNSCGLGFERIAILPNGDIVPCMPMRNFVLGNIKTDDLVDVFNNHPVMKEIRESTVDKIKECRNCPAKERCLGGCKQRAFAMHGRFNAPDDVQCVVFKKNHKPKLEHPENFPLK